MFSWWKGGKSYKSIEQSIRDKSEDDVILRALLCERSSNAFLEVEKSIKKIATFFGFYSSFFVCWRARRFNFMDGYTLSITIKCARLFLLSRSAGCKNWGCAYYFITACNRVVRSAQPDIIKVDSHPSSRMDFFKVLISCEGMERSCVQRRERERERVNVAEGLKISRRQFAATAPACWVEIPETLGRKTRETMACARCCSCWHSPTALSPF